MAYQIHSFNIDSDFFLINAIAEVYVVVDTTTYTYKH